MLYNGYFVRGVVGLSYKKYLMLLALIVLLGISLSWYFLNKREIPVLGYHEINNKEHSPLALSTTEFDAQMQYLHAAGYTPITPDDLLQFLRDGKELPYKSVLITFDDGYEDNYIDAYPILKKYGIKATIFLISHDIGLPGYLNWQEIHEMSQNHILFEGHTFNHPHLDKIQDDDELKKQLADSKVDLENHLGYKVDYLAYPYGDYNAHVIEKVKEYGYLAAFTVHLGDDTVQDDLFTLHRVPVFQAYTHTFIRFWLSLHCPYFMKELQYASAKWNKMKQSYF